MAPCSHSLTRPGPRWPGMMTAVRLRVPVLPLALVCAVTLGAASGCGGDDPGPATGPGLPSQAALTSYFEAITSGDADAVAAAGTKVAAEGSAAAGYATYVAETDRAATADGAEGGGAVDVEEVDGGFRACIAEGRCVTWTGLKGQDGRLADFTISGTQLSDSLVDLTAQAPIRSAGLYTVQPGWAYRLPSGILNVVVTVTATDVALSPQPGTYIEGDQ